ADPTKAVDGTAPDGHDYTDAELDAIAQEMTDFMNSVFVAQSESNEAGPLYANGATGGVVNLSKQEHYFGKNDLLENDFKTLAPFDATVMTMYSAWLTDPDP